MRRKLAAVVREELEAAAERGNVAFTNWVDDMGYSPDLDIRAAILSRPRLTRARERKSR